jgi:hypothetical protein
LIGVLSSVSNAVPLTPGGYPVPGGPASGTFGTGGSPNISVGQGGGFGLASLAGVLVGILAIIVVLAIVGVFVIVVVANRADPDPSGRRPQSVYFFAISFVTLLTAIVGSAVVVSALVQLIGSHPGSSIGNSVARVAVLGGLATLVGLVLFLVHLRRGLELSGAGPESTSPSRRVGQSYVSAVAFLSVLVILVTTVLAIYLVCALAGPGVFGSFGGRTPALRYLIDAVYVGVVAVVVLATHRRLVAPGLQFFGPGYGTGGATGVVSPTVAPPRSPLQ